VALASGVVLDRPPLDDGLVQRLRTGAKRALGEGVIRTWEAAVELGAIGPDTRRGKRFGYLGAGSVICFPPNAIFNERYIHIGAGTMFGPQITLSAGMVPGQRMVSDPVISVGERCLIGKGSGIVGHLQIVIGDDVWTGHHVYITDQNHGYSDPDLPISRQVMPERPVSIGDGSWLGHGTVVLPGATIGAMSSWGRTVWSPDRCPTTAWPPVCRHGSSRRSSRGSGTHRSGSESDH
jgi:hypothetical protein